MYSARRMFAASEWLNQEMEKRDQVVAGRVLAVANLAFWGVNLFAFLLPFYLPKALNRYYCGSDSQEDDSAAIDVDDDANKKKDS
uniref:DUF7733 domain-containing protein n=1 Tax=Oryza brachyantha TaxID=4533 RepID=J3N4N0_ORYBR